MRQRVSQKATHCLVEGCERPPGNGWYCLPHYKRKLRYGDPLAGGAYRIIGDDVARFWSKVRKSDDSDGCWFWTERTDARGYGAFYTTQTAHGGPSKAHRWAYELLIGPIPDGKYLDHTCHKPTRCAGGVDCPHRRCVNPAHLEPVTNEENLRRADRWKLDDAQVRKLFERWCAGEKQTDLAEEVGVAQTTLSKAFSRRKLTRPRPARQSE